MFKSKVSLLAVLLMTCLLSFDAQAKDYGCLENIFTSCLQEGRFKVQGLVSYTDVADGMFKTKSAQIKDVIIGDEASLFYFFTFNNPELLIKVVNGCWLNGKYWIFGSAATDLNYSVTITDMKTGKNKVYTRNSSNPLINETDAFNCN